MINLPGIIECWFCLKTFRRMEDAKAETCFHNYCPIVKLHVRWQVDAGCK